MFLTDRLMSKVFVNQCERLFLFASCLMLLKMSAVKLLVMCWLKCKHLTFHISLTV